MTWCCQKMTCKTKSPCLHPTMYCQSDEEKSVMNHRVALSLAEEKKKFINEKKDDTFLEDIKNFLYFTEKKREKA